MVGVAVAGQHVDSQGLDLAGVQGPERERDEERGFPDRGSILVHCAKNLRASQSGNLLAVHGGEDLAVDLLLVEGPQHAFPPIRTTLQVDHEHL